MEDATTVLPREVNSDLTNFNLSDDSNIACDNVWKLDRWQTEMI